jgi:hypothetical protein
VTGCCECGDEPSGSCATELVSYVFYPVETFAWKPVIVPDFIVIFLSKDRRCF